MAAGRKHGEKKELNFNLEIASKPHPIVNLLRFVTRTRNNSATRQKSLQKPPITALLTPEMEVVMREMTGGEYDELATKRPELHSEPVVAQEPSYVPEHYNEGTCSMEHPHIKIENEPKFIDRQGGGGYGGGWGGDCGLGGLGGGGLLLGALLGRSLFNHDGDGRRNGGEGCERPVFDAAILGKLGTLEGAVPLVGSQTQTAIALSTGQITTNALQVALGQAGQATAIALANQSQIAGVKDSVQAGTFSTAIGIRDDGDKTRALISANENAALNRQLGVLETTLLLERHGRGFDRDHNSLVIQNTNTANAMQQQQQQQGFQIGRLFDMLHCCDQNIRATNQAINIGGTQLATPTNTSTNNRVN